MGYADSQYYGRQSEILERWYDRKITEAERDEQLLAALEEELAHPEIYGLWLVGHFNSAAEYLSENSQGCYLKSELDKIPGLVKTAKKEIEIFKKYGHKGTADWMADELNEFFEALDSGEFEQGIKEREDGYEHIHHKYGKDYKKPSDEEIHEAVMKLTDNLKELR